MRVYIEKATRTVTLIPTIQIFTWHGYTIKNKETKIYKTFEIKFLFLKYTVIIKIEGKQRNVRRKP